MATSDSTSQIIEILLSNGQVAIVDECDLTDDLLFPKWQPSKKAKGCYVRRFIKPYINKRGTAQYLHRLIMERILGRPLEKGERVDHENLNPLDNRRSNLRLATQAQNAQNSGIRPNNKSGYKGVINVDGYWRVKITLNGISKDLGRYASALDAAIAYNHAAAKHFGEFSNPNPIPGWETITPRKLTLSKLNKSGYAGVSKDRNKWRAIAYVNGKPKSIGTFNTPEEAHQAREAFLKKAV